MPVLRLPWQYVSENLRDSDLTVHNRNKAAGRFSIGCAKILAESELSEKGGWSIFRSNKAEESHYCSLQMISTRGESMVTVLNRSGLEVASADAKSIFTRLLNN